MNRAVARWPRAKAETINFILDDAAVAFSRYPSRMNRPTLTDTGTSLTLRHNCLTFLNYLMSCPK